MSGSHTSLRNEESRDIRNHRSDETFIQKIGESTCDQDKKLDSDGDSSTSDAVSTVEDPLRDGEESSEESNLAHTTFKSYSLEKRSNPEIAYAAVMSDPDNIRYVPANIDQREKIVKAALQQNGYFLKYLTDEEKSNKRLVSLSLQQFYDASIDDDSIDDDSIDDASIDDDSIDDIASFISPFMTQILRFIQILNYFIN